MTCVKASNAIYCINHSGRMKVGRKYIWIDYMDHCGPEFFCDAKMTRLYKPRKNDPVWDEYAKWHDKFSAKRNRMKI